MASSRVGDFFYGIGGLLSSLWYGQTGLGAKQAAQAVSGGSPSDQKNSIQLILDELNQKRDELAELKKEFFKFKRDIKVRAEQITVIELKAPCSEPEKASSEVKEIVVAKKPTTAELIHNIIDVLIKNISKDTEQLNLLINKEGKTDKDYVEICDASIEIENKLQLAIEKVKEQINKAHDLQESKLNIVIEIICGRLLQIPNILPKMIQDSSDHKLSISIHEDVDRTEKVINDVQANLVVAKKLLSKNALTSHKEEEAQHEPIETLTVDSTESEADISMGSTSPKILKKLQDSREQMVRKEVLPSQSRIVNEASSQTDEPFDEKGLLRDDKSPLSKHFLLASKATEKPLAEAEVQTELRLL